MGVKFFEILPQHPVRLDDLKHKTIVIDGNLVLYQFLSSIRGPDGTPLTDSAGNVTSHLQGLFSRTVNLRARGVKLAFVFDGKPPELKRAVQRERAKAKERAQEAFNRASEEADTASMRKFAARTSRLTSPMVAEARELLDALGIPCIMAPSEGEAQAVRIVKDGNAYAVGTQDADVFMFGSPRLIKNLTVSERRKVPGRQSYVTVEPERFELAEVLAELKITQRQLILMGMLVGTDYNPGGIRGIGAKKALKLVKEHDSPSALFKAVEWETHWEIAWEDVLDAIENVETTDAYELSFAEPRPDVVEEILCNRHEFSSERVRASLLRIRKDNQMGLGQWA